MAELPDEFDSKRDLDAWLARVVDTYTKYTAPDNAIQNPLDAKEYTTDRSAALDLLEAFCEEHDLDFKVYPQQVEIKRFAGFVGLWTIQERYDEDYTIDPLAVSVAIYRAFKKIEEGNRDS